MTNDDMTTGRRQLNSSKVEKLKGSEGRSTVQPFNLSTVQLPEGGRSTFQPFNLSTRLPRRRRFAAAPPCAALFSLFAAAALAAAAAVPPVVVSNMVVQSIGEERNAVELEEGLLFRGNDDELWMATGAAPHGKRVGQAAAESAAASARSEAASALAAHAADRTNPHEVTAVQAGALPRTGGTVTGNVTLSSPTGGNSPALFWADGPDAAAEGNWKALVTSHMLYFGLWKDGGWKYPVQFWENGRIVCMGVYIPTNSTAGTNRGLTIGDRTWYSLPDTNSFAAAAAAVSSNLAVHAAAFDNPHAVTLRQAWDADTDDAGDFAADELGLTLDGGEISAISGVRGRGIDFYDGSVTGDFTFVQRPFWQTNGLATTGEVASVERRAAALEAATGEYWCKWPGDSLSTTETNWIPTNWPTRTVYCYAYCESGTYNIAVPSNTVFAPAAPHTLHLRVFKTADATVYIRTAGGSSLGSFSGNSIIHRDVELAWRPGIGWICTQTHIDAAPQYSSNDSSAKHVRGADLPDDGFLPWFATNAPANLSLSAPLQTPENHSPTSGETTETGLQGLEGE